MADDLVDRINEQWRRVRPDIDTSTVEVIGRISRLAAVLERAMGENFARHGLQPGWFDVLASLRRAGEPYELTPTALLETMMLTSGAITKRIDKLEEAGLVTRRADPSDGRGVLVRLTDEGLTRTDAAMDDHLAVQRELLSGLTTAQRRELTELLRTLTLALER